MRLCVEHWQDLHKALNSRGLNQWISKTENELEIAARSDSYEPLLGALRNIQLVAINHFGLSSEWRGCPLCYIDKVGCQCTCSACTAGWTWMDEVASAELEKARSLNLVPKAS